jgi:hypothetical protein
MTHYLSKPVNDLIKLSNWFKRANGAARKLPFILKAIALSALLHGLVLWQLNTHRAPPIPPHTAAFSVQLMPQIVPSPALISTAKITPVPFIHRRPLSLARQSIPPLDAPEISVTRPSNSVAPAALDVANLLKQAHRYAQQEAQNSAPSMVLAGDYYGSYDGWDNGTFYFHLDHTGRAIGSGKSDKYGISFMITGSANSEGLIDMLGSGIAGDAKFKGRLHAKSRQLTGTWTLSGLGSGTFTGKHE